MIKAFDCGVSWVKSRDFNLELRTRIYAEKSMSTVAAIPDLFVSCWFEQLGGWKS